MFDETCDLTDDEAQEATSSSMSQCESWNIHSWHPPNRLEKSFGILYDLCVHGNTSEALYIMILTDSEDALSEEQFWALETLHRSEGSAWLGRDLQQVGIGARLDSNLPAMSRARVWTNSFTVAEHVQQEAIAREGPSHSEELFHLLKTVIQGEALSHAMQFSQRLRDTADEELVTLLETFVATAHREPDLAEELDRAEEAAEAEVDEAAPSPAQQQQLLRAHVNLGHPTNGESADGESSDREVYGLVSGMSGWRSRIVSQLKEEGYEMNVYEPCLFSKFAVREEPAVDEGSIAPGEFVGCVFLEVDDHLMGGPGKAHRESMDSQRQKIKFGKWHRLLQDGPSFFGGRHFTQLPD